MLATTRQVQSFLPSLRRSIAGSALAAADAVVEQGGSGFVKYADPIPVPQMGMNQVLNQLPETKVRDNPTQ